MKKLTTLLLTVLMLVAVFASCNETPVDTSSGFASNDSQGNISDENESESSHESGESSEPTEESGNSSDGSQIKNIAEYFGYAKNDNYGHNTYFIFTAEEFENFAMLVETATYDFYGDTVCLAKDIEINPTDNYDNWKNETPEKAWNPIGSQSFPFRGDFIGVEMSGTDFDEQLRTISGLYYQTNDSNSEFALFDTIDGSRISNIVIDKIGSDGKSSVYGIAVRAFNTKIEYCENNSDITSEGSVAGFVGENYGSITHCVNNGNLTTKNGSAGGIVLYNKSGGAVTLTENNGEINGKISTAGIAAEASGMIMTCINNGNIAGEEAVAGIVAKLRDYDYLYIARCTNNGDITAKYTAGGIFGAYGIEMWDSIISFSVKGCLNTGNIKATESGPLETTGVWVPDIQGAGGIIGGIEDTIYVENDFIIKNCLNIGKIECDYQSGGVVGNRTAPKHVFDKCYYLEDTAPQTAIGTIVDKDELKNLKISDWTFDEEVGHVVPDVSTWNPDIYIGIQ